MKTRNVIMICTLLWAATAWTAMATTPKSNDSAKPGKIDKIYAALLQPDKLELSSAEFIEAFEKVDRQAVKYLGTVGDEQLKKQSLIRYSRIFDAREKYQAGKDKKAGQELQTMAERLAAGFDPDSPDLELLNDNEVTTLLDGYFSAMHPELSNSVYYYVYRATHVLYNIKSDKVRKAYVCPALTRTLNDCGYTGLAHGLFEDIAICVKDEEFLQYSAGLDAEYKKLDAGKQAPQINMENAAGKKILLSDYRGKYVLISVWGAAAKGYEYELTAFGNLRSKYPHENFVAIALSSDPRDKWSDSVKDMPCPGGVVDLRTSDLDVFVNDYKIGALPRYILINSEGKIINAWFQSAANFFLTNQLEAALNPHLMSR